MKNTIVFFSLLFSISAFSQQNKWGVGIVGGPGITGLRSEWYKPSPTLGFYTGLSAQYNFNNYFALHTELAFDRKGTSDKFSLTDSYGNAVGTAKITNQLNYLTMPVLFRASIGKKVKYFLQAGPYLSYLLNQTIKTVSTTDEFHYIPRINGTSHLPTMDFGMSAGLGILVPVKEKFSVSCELRGNYGLVNLLSKGSGNIKEFNETLNMLLGITYKIGK
ncbi:MAG TPA: porin family protein [Cytophaga sp.]|jgi:hypothetical protein|nr:porin family protein [Cytophaga sp.]